MIRITIAGLARHGGVGVETVRLYQRRGLLDTPDRAGSIRRYGAEDIRRVLFIRAAQTAGFTLDEIGQLLSLDASQDRARALHLAQERLAMLDRKIADLQKARTALQRLAVACARSGTGACPIISAFDAGD